MSPQPSLPPGELAELAAANRARYGSPEPAEPANAQPEDWPSGKGVKVLAYHNAVAVTCATCGELTGGDAQAHTGQTGHATTKLATTLTMYGPDT
jgi:hypothetical protein